MNKKLEDFLFKRYLHYLPNLLTILRIVLTLPFLYYLKASLTDGDSWTITLALFLLVILSDIFDGRVARKFSCESLLGAKLDIVADSFFSLLSTALMVIYNLLPLWYLLLIIFKLVEFVITSKIVGNKNKSSLPIFDSMGKIGGCGAMLVPGLAIIPVASQVTAIVISLLFFLSLFNRFLLFKELYKKKQNNTLLRRVS